MVDPTIVQAVQRYLRALNEHGLPTLYGVLFGSYARNKAQPWSDIDVVVVSPRFDDTPRREDVRLLWRIAARVDSRIEPVAVGSRQYESGDTNAIVEIARREGIRLYSVPTA